MTDNDPMALTDDDLAWVIAILDDERYRLDIRHDSGRAQHWIDRIDAVRPKIVSLRAQLAYPAEASQ